MMAAVDQNIRHLRSLLVLVGGLPASGKTVFARSLSTAIGAVHINSDSLRAELGLLGHYDAGSKQKVYDAMYKKGRAALTDNKAVVVDSTFYKKNLRKPWLRIAHQLDLPACFIVIEVAEEIALKRLEREREDSEADKSVYRKIKEAWEPIEIEHLALDSGRLSLAEMIDEAISFISKKATR